MRNFQNPFINREIASSQFNGIIIKLKTLLSCRFMCYISLTKNSFHSFSFTDQQRYHLCGNIQRRQSGISQHIWVNWCAIPSIRLDGRLDVVNFGRNVRLVQLHYCSSIKKTRAAFRAIEIYSSWAGEQLKWKRMDCLSRCYNF